MRYYKQICLQICLLYSVWNSYFKIKYRRAWYISVCFNIEYTFLRKHTCIQRQLLNKCERSELMLEVWSSKQRYRYYLSLELVIHMYMYFRGTEIKNEWMNLKRMLRNRKVKIFHKENFKLPLFIVGIINVLVINLSQLHVITPMQERQLYST